MVAVGITTNIDREELEKVFDELIYVNSTDRLMAQLTNVIDEVSIKTKDIKLLRYTS